MKRYAIPSETPKISGGIRIWQMNLIGFPVAADFGHAGASTQIGFPPNTSASLDE